MAVISLTGLLMDKGGAPSLERWRKTVVGQLEATGALMEAVAADFSEACSSPYVRLNVVKVKTVPYRISNHAQLSHRLDLRWRLTGLGGDITGLGEWTACELLGNQQGSERGIQLASLWKRIQKETPMLAHQLQVYDTIRHRLRNEYAVYWRVIVMLNDIIENAGWLLHADSEEIVNNARSKLQILKDVKKIEVDI